MSHFFQEFGTTKETLTKKAENRSFPGFEKEQNKAWKGPFYFIQGADTQFGMIDSNINGRLNPTWDEEIKLAKKAVKAVNEMSPRPRFFIICGDLIDAMPGTKYRNAQEKDFIHVFKKLHPDIPLICVCGNHDIDNIPTSATVQNYRDRFGDDYFTFYCDGVMFIVLNSQFFESPYLVKALAKEQEVWLDRQLQEAKSGNYKHVIVFQHVPWFIRSPDEKWLYISCCERISEIRKEMLEKFYEANIKAIFCGHYHRNAGGFYKDMQVVVTSAIGCQLGSDKSGFRIVKLGENSIDHKYYAFEDVPKNITFE